MYKVGKVITKEWTKGNSAETFIFVLGNTSQKKIDFFRALPKLSFREAINCEKKIFVKKFRKREGGLTDFIPLFHFSKHPSNTLQTPCNTLQTPLKHPSTPFKQPSKSSLFSLKKWTKKINRDFIKGGRGGAIL